VSCQAGEIRAVYGEYTVPAGAGIGDRFDLVELPGEHVPVDALLSWDDLGTTGKGNVGITNDPVGDTEDADLVCNDTVAVFTTAGFSRATNPALFTLAPVNNVRKLGLVLTEETTAAGKVRLTLFYRTKQSQQELA
jgi:hypothetical protein